FSSQDEVLLALNVKKIGLQEWIRVRVNGHSVATTPGRVVFNEALPLNKEPTEVDEPALEFQNDHFDRKKLRALVSRIFRLYGNDVTAAVSNEIKKVGFRHATRAGITISALDLPAPANKADILARAEKEVEEVERMYRRGVMTEDERYRKVIDIWSKATEDRKSTRLNSSHLVISYAVCCLKKKSMTEA